MSIRFSFRGIAPAITSFCRRPTREPFFLWCLLTCLALAFLLIFVGESDGISFDGIATFLTRDRVIAQRIVAASADADVLVGAGDFAMRGIGLSDTLDILKGVRVPLIVVSGNHDNSKELRQACEAASMLRYLDGDGATFGGVTFFGIGREIPFQKNAPWSESYSE